MNEFEIVKLGEKEYKLPALTIRQNKVIEPLIVKRKAFFDMLIANRGAFNLGDVTGEQMEDFIIIVWTALTKVDKTLTLDQFESLNLSSIDIVQALAPCILQTGLFRRAVEATTEKAPPTGEAIAPSTGTASPQN